MPEGSVSVCKGCPCDRPACIPPSRKRAKVAVVLDFPSESEARKEEWLAGGKAGAGAVLKALLSHYANLDDLYITSALKCRPNPKKKAMIKKGMLACKDSLRAELRAAGVEKVLSVGSVGYSALMDLENVVAPTVARGRWKITPDGFNLMSTIPPGFLFGAELNVAYFRDMDHDAKRFFTEEGREPWPDVEVWIPDTLEEAMEAFDWLEAQDTHIGVDLETYGFSPIANTILAAGFAVLEENKKDATVVVFDEGIMERKKTWRRISRLLNSPEVELVLHNGKFDLQFLKEALLRKDLPYDPKNLHDTMMLHYALDERPMGKFKSHGLEHLARIYFDAPDYGIPMGKWLETYATANKADRKWMERDMWIYLSLDAYYTARLFPVLWNEAVEEDERLLDLYDDFLMPGTLVLADVEHHGVKINKTMFEESAQKLRKKARRLQGKIQRETGIPDFNPGSSQQVKAYVYEELKLDGKVATKALVEQAEEGRNIANRGATEGARSRGTYTDPKRLKESPTAAPVLRMLARGYPEHEDLLEDICEYRNLTKNAGTYLEGILKRLDVDGRLRGSFNLHGTATGRLSSSNPNLQNVPPVSHTGIPIRSGFIAPPGHVIIGADYKQLEVRVAAQLSCDPAMYELFATGRDVHAEISHTIYNMPPEEISQYMRMLGKIVLFGLLYGRSPNSVATGPEQEDIVARGGRRWTPDEVHEFFDNLLSDWAVYAEWRQNLYDTAYANGEIQLPSGRKRRFEFIPVTDGGHTGRAGLNTPVQGTASDVCLDALMRFMRHPDKPPSAHVILTVHDAIYVECKRVEAKRSEDLLREVMEDSPFFQNLPGRLDPGAPSVPLKADIKMGKVWDEEDEKQGTGIVKKPKKKAAPRSRQKAAA